MRAKWSLLLVHILNHQRMSCILTTLTTLKFPFVSKKKKKMPSDASRANVCIQGQHFYKDYKEEAVLITLSALNHSINALTIKKMSHYSGGGFHLIYSKTNEKM